MTRQEAIEKVGSLICQRTLPDRKISENIVDMLRPDLKPTYWVCVLAGKIRVASEMADHLDVWFGPGHGYTELQARELAQRECDRLNKRDQDRKRG